eukprot:2504664-Pleurochrysis_carterae.AAC.1
MKLSSDRLSRLQDQDCKPTQCILSHDTETAAINSCSCTLLLGYQLIASYRPVGLALYGRLN